MVELVLFVVVFVVPFAVWRFNRWELDQMEPWERAKAHREAQARRAAGR